MSVSNERAELQKQQEGLESTIMTMTSEGIPIPEDLSSKLTSVRQRIAELGGGVNIKPWTSWLGQTIEEFTVTECLSRGSYSNVFRARNSQTGQDCAFKISATDEKIAVNGKEYFSKQAFVFDSEILQQLEISANDALQMECERLQADITGCFVKVLSTGSVENHSYYRMPLLQGQSLRELAGLTDGVLFQFLPELFSRIAKLIDRVAESSLHYHGNLKPDSVLITKDDAVLLSPGVFGGSNGTAVSKLVFTTPAYYPFYEPNDTFALGCVLWEMICKRHPLSLEHTEDRMSLFAPEMREMLEYRKALSHEPLCNISRVRMPAEIRPNLADSTEVFLMKSIKLSFDQDGYITGDPGFKNAVDLAEALDKVATHGIFRAS